MSTFNIVLLSLIIASIIYGLFVLIIGFRQEYQLHKRGNICYANYFDYKPYFNRSISPLYLILSGIACAFLITLIALVSFNVQMRIYTIALGFTLVIVALMIYMHISSIKYNRDLYPFDEFYDVIKSSYANKEKIENNIKVIDEKYQIINKSISSLNERLTNLIKDFVAIPNLEDCLKPLDKIRAEQEAILASFNTNLSEVFDKAIKDYLVNNGTVSASNYIFNPDKELRIDKVMNEISLAVKEKFKLYVIDSFKNLKHKNSNALIELSNLMYSYDAFEPEYATVLLKAVINEPNEYLNVVDYMYSKKLIDFDMINLCVNADYEWIFTQKVTPFVTKNEFVNIVVNIIKKNSLKVTNKFLILCEKGDAEYIKNALTIAALSNETSTLMTNYIELLQIDGGFNSLSTRYENIGYALNYYYNVIGTGNVKIKEIIDKENYLAFKDYLDSTYNSVLVNLEPLLMKSFRTMLYYSMYCKDKVALFEMKKIYFIYSEYKRTLNVTGLLCLTSLLDAIMCTYITDKSALDAINMNINDNAKLKEYDLYYPISNNKGKNLKGYGKDLLTNLIKRKKNELTTIVNHIEKERLTFDKIRYI